MKPSLAFAAAALTASLISAPARTDPACRPAHVATDQAELSPQWRDALRALVEATSRPGRPWSCGNELLRLEVDEHANVAELHIDDAQGRGRARVVDGPEELLPTGEALLAVSLAANRPSAPNVTRPGPSEPDLPRSPSPAPRVPRFALEAWCEPRFEAPTNAVWVAFVLRATVPFGAWSAGVWARASGPVQILDVVPENFTMSEVSIGLTGARRLLDAPVAIEVSFDPSLAIVSMEGGPGPEQPSGSKLDLRLGTSLRALLPLSTSWRAMVGINGELAPLGLGSGPQRRVDPTLPRVPALGTGLAFGLQLLLR